MTEQLVVSLPNEYKEKIAIFKRLNYRFWSKSNSAVVKKMIDEWSQIFFLNDKYNAAIQNIFLEEENASMLVEFDKNKFDKIKELPLPENEKMALYKKLLTRSDEAVEMFEEMKNNTQDFIKNNSNQQVKAQSLEKLKKGSMSQAQRLGT